MEAVCVLFNEKPDWDTAKRLLSDAQFVTKLIGFDKDNVPEPVRKKLKKFVEDPDFEPEVVKRVSLAAKSLCMWVKAIDAYCLVRLSIRPLEEKHHQVGGRGGKGCVRLRGWGSRGGGG
jgi:dynein heavy chain, axonemal